MNEPTVGQRVAQYTELRDGYVLSGPVVKIKTKHATSKAIQWAYWRADERMEYPRLVAAPRKRLLGGWVCVFRSSTRAG